MAHIKITSNANEVTLDIHGNKNTLIEDILAVMNQHDDAAYLFLAAAGKYKQSHNNPADTDE